MAQARRETCGRADKPLAAYYTLEACKESEKRGKKLLLWRAVLNVLL